ncbi:MAG: IMP cyclohydrolase [Spirochaetales bacterium]|nr:IMP cyclohydrolase [Spirochaetales bacterium]
MKGSSLSRQYREFAEDAFPARLEISFADEAGMRVTFHYEKATWVVDGERKGLRYGENPDQGAALYRPLDGNVALAGGEMLAADGSLVSSAELLQSGKHPGKTNLTDVDSGLSILRHLAATPACAVMKHNNPSGVARAPSLAEAYRKALMADRVAAFGGAVVVNRELDPETARAISESYCEVVAAPEFAPGAFDILAARKNLRVIRVPEIARLEKWAPARVLDFRSLVDGGLVVQTSFRTRVAAIDDFLPAFAVKDGREYRVVREPSAAELEDMLFGWLVETGVTSNSVLFVKDGATVGIGAGEQDRVGVAEIARDKAYRKLEDRLCFERTGTPWNLQADEGLKASIREEVAAASGGLRGAVMVSDAFFPFRDGIDVGLREGVSAVVQPGGSLRDFEVIQACNEAGAAMKFTGQRCFRH